MTYKVACPMPWISECGLEAWHVVCGAGYYTGRAAILRQIGIDPPSVFSEYLVYIFRPWCGVQDWYLVGPNQRHRKPTWPVPLMALPEYLSISFSNIIASVVSVTSSARESTVQACGAYWVRRVHRLGSRWWWISGLSERHNDCQSHGQSSLAKKRGAKSWDIYLSYFQHTRGPDWSLSRFQS